FETPATKRKILEKWWHSSGQTGSLNPCSQRIARPQGIRSVSAIEFPVFCESVRVLKCVRALCERR
ncbi:DNA (cytosine-5)-methyltransferase DRM2, partial [Trifolium medium]|nr:DNA (cytosine-5)-methyltransferase DRM2 [Trifolium medium]